MKAVELPVMKLARETPQKTHGSPAKSAINI